MDLHHESGKARRYKMSTFRPDATANALGGFFAKSDFPDKICPEKLTKNCVKYP